MFTKNCPFSHNWTVRSGIFLFFALFLCFVSAFAQVHRSTKSSAELLHDILSINNRASVLYVAAHPDDENTRLIAYLRNELHADVTYLSITRGDGGQNLIGTELREDLGLIRTNELLKARSVDGGNQLFTRANDFGYSKHHNETLAIWDKEKVLSDVVRAIRKTQPDIIITRFDTTGGSTHGHHTASAILALQAFDLAADKNAYPEHFADGLAPWEAKNIFWNAYSWRGVSNDVLNHPDLITLEVGKQNPLLGYTYDELAALSRSKHKSQGFGSSPRYGSQVEYLIPWKNGLSKAPFIDVLSKTWDSDSQLKKTASSLQSLIDSFNVFKPELSVVNALKLSKAVEGTHAAVAKELRDWAFEASGITVRFLSPDANLVEGTSYETRLEIANPLGIDAKVLDVWVNGEATERKENGDIGSSLWTASHKLSINHDAVESSPYWLNQAGELGVYSVKNSAHIGMPMNQALINATWDLILQGEPLRIKVPLEYTYTDPVKGEVVEPIGLMPRITLEVEESLSIKSDMNPFTVKLHITNHTKNEINFNIGADLSDTSWRISFPQTAINLAAGRKKSLEIQLEPSSKNSVTEVVFWAQLNGKKYDRFQTQISYDHLPVLKSLKQTKAKLVQVDVVATAKKVLYINGAGDKVAEGIRKMGVDVLEIVPSSLPEYDLSQFDAVISGIRAYNVAPNLMAEANKQLNDYVLNGGNYIIQYNTLSRELPDKLGPISFTISRDRVTDEFSEVRLLSANHPVLQNPNKINQTDFDGWVQERGLYFASSWDAAFQPILSMNDVGEDPKEGALLVAKHGKGTVVFTGLSFFRELPAGVPGAYRLLANILSL